MTSSIDHSELEARARELGFESKSAYIRGLIRDDLQAARTGETRADGG